MNGATPEIVVPVGPRFGARSRSRLRPFVPVYARPADSVRLISRWRSTFQRCTYPMR